jgi:hypothetical protein
MWQELVVPLFRVRGAWMDRRSPGGALNRASPEYAAGALQPEGVYCTQSFASKNTAAKRAMLLVCDRALCICIC